MGVVAAPDEVERLFDEGRDPESRVKDSDWHPGGGFAELDACDTLEQRRGWLLALRHRGRA